MPGGGRRGGESGDLHPTGIHSCLTLISPFSVKCMFILANSSRSYFISILLKY